MSHLIGRCVQFKRGTQDTIHKVLYLSFVIFNNSCDLNRYIIGLYYPCGLQTITDFIQFLILQIMRGCGGFPLALEVNGKSLYGRPLEAWRSRARKWSNGHSIFNTSSDLLHCLRKSLEFLDDKDILKDYFMDLGSFAESQRIDVPSLIDIWEVLHDFDEDGNDAIDSLHELTTRNLATLVMTRDGDFILLSDILVVCFLGV